MFEFYIVSDAVLPHISKQMEELNRREIALKQRERVLENSINKHNLTTQDTNFKEN